MSATMREASILLQFAASYANEIDSTLLNTDGRISLTVQQRFEDGNAVNQCERCWGYPAVALTSGNSFKLDLFDLGSIDIGNGPGRDPVGQYQQNAELVALFIRNRDTSTGTLHVGGEGSSAAWTAFFDGNADELIFPPGAWMILACPLATAYAIVDATNHLLQFEANGGDLTLDIFMLTRDS